MTKLLTLIVMLAMIFGASGTAMAAVLTFDDPNNLGVTIGGHMEWNDMGGGHFFMNTYDDTDYIYFSTPTYLNDFKMNGKPWQDYNGGSDVVDLVSMAAFDSSNTQLWSVTIDLSNYQNWNNWYTVSVERGGVSRLEYYATGSLPDDTGFWPSIDNMRINENSTVPEPATMVLFGIAGLAMAAGKVRKAKKA